MQVNFEMNARKDHEKKLEEKIVKVKEKSKQQQQQNGHDQDDPESRCLQFCRDKLQLFNLGWRERGLKEGGVGSLGVGQVETG